MFDRRIGGRTPGRFRTHVITRELVVAGSDAPPILEAAEAPATSPLAGASKTSTNYAKSASQPIGVCSTSSAIGHDCFIGEAAFQDMQRPVTIGDQHAAALHFADPHVQALLHVLLLFILVQGTFTHKDLRGHLVPLLGQNPGQRSPGQITDDLRRLRLHGRIERIPEPPRIFYTRLYSRSLRSGLATISPAAGLPP